MPIHGYPGNVITSNAVVPNSGSASGVWTTEQQLQAQNAGNWPQANQILRSLRFNQADDTYLNRTPAGAGNRTTWTWSAWVKRSNLGDFQYSIFAAGSGSNYDEFRLNTANQFRFFIVSGGSVVLDLLTTQVFRDPSAWYHFVVAYDSTQATASNRAKLYVNGEQITTLSTATYPAQNTSTTINNNVQHTIGLSLAAGFEYNGYMTEVNFIDGQALTPSSFGQTNGNTGVWEPKRYSGSYGTNGFYLTFQDNSGTTSTTLGKDYSGNGNNWTPNNFSVSAGAGNDSLVDTPTSYGTDTGVGGEVRGNYCTLNPLYGTPAPSNGNLDVTVSSQTVYGTMSFTSSKWYWEVTPTSLSGDAYIGVMDSTYIRTDSSWGTSTSATYTSSGTKYGIGGAGSYGASYTSNDVIGVALDMDVGTITFYKNGVSQGTAFTGMTGREWRPMVYGGTGTNNFVTNFGQRPFAYTAPSGYKALCTQNLPTPAIGATSTTQAGDYFNPVLYTGNGFPTSGTQSITGVGFQPDFVWIKNRSNVGNNTLTDAVRGVNSQLFSNTTAAQETNTDTVTALNADGFSLGANATGNTNTNVNNQTYVAWNWKANGAGSSNTAGSITSTVSANTTSGFSIVTYTGTGSGTATIGHGLGVAPSMIIVKFRNTTSNWSIYHASVGNTKRLVFTTAAEETGSGYWNNTTPTSTVFTLGTDLNQAYNFVAYCFAPIAGYSAFGSYTGNGSTDGPFIFTGFRPRYLLIKDTTGATNYWVVLDTSRSPYNAAALGLYPNTSDADDAFTYADILSNGFKIRNSSGNTNTSSSIYIYAAFAEFPFKYTLAR